MCLVDSGADLCLVPAKIGEILGINIESGSREEIGGIAETPIVGVDVVAGFTESKGVRAGILGQRDFFDKYRITFQRSRNWIDIAE